jgi:hypothetical protein
MCSRVPALCLACPSQSDNESVEFRETIKDYARLVEAVKVDFDSTCLQMSRPF